MAEFVTKSTREAAALGQSWVGSEHLLLALTKDRQVGPLLAELGLTHNRLADYLRVRRHDPPAPSLEANQLPRPSPRLYRVMGWAEGFAAERGAEPGAADWLMAAIFEDISESGLLDSFGVMPEDVIRRFDTSGIRVPKKAPPIYRPWRNHHRIYVDDNDVEPLIQLLAQRYPPGSDLRWGLNRAGSKSQVYFDAEEGIDLSGMLAAVRQSRPA